MLQQSGASKTWKVKKWRWAVSGNERWISADSEWRMWYALLEAVVGLGQVMVVKRIV